MYWEQIANRVRHRDVTVYDDGILIDTGRKSLDENIPTIVYEDGVRLEDMYYRDETNSLHVFLTEDTPS